MEREEVPPDEQVRIDEGRVAVWTVLAKPIYDRVEELLEEDRPWLAFNLAIDSKSSTLFRDHVPYGWSNERWVDLVERALRAALKLDDPRRSFDEVAFRWNYLRRAYPSVPSGVKARVGNYFGKRAREEMRMLVEVGEVDEALRLGTIVQTLIPGDHVDEACHQASLVKKNLAHLGEERRLREEHHFSRAHDLQSHRPRLALLHAKVGSLWAAINGRRPRLPPIVVRRDEAQVINPPIVLRSVTGCESESPIGKALRGLIQRKGEGDPILVDVKATTCKHKVATLSVDKTVHKTTNKVPGSAQVTRPVWVTEVRMEERCRTVTECSTGGLVRELGWYNYVTYCAEKHIVERVRCIEVPVKYRVQRMQTTSRKILREVAGEVTVYRTSKQASYELSANAEITWAGRTKKIEASGKGVGGWGEKTGAGRKRFYTIGTSAAQAKQASMSPLVSRIRKTAAEMIGEAKASMTAARAAKRESLTKQVSEAKKRGDEDAALEALLALYQDFRVGMTAEDRALLAARMDMPDMGPLYIPIDPKFEDRFQSRLKKLAAESEKRMFCPHHARMLDGRRFFAADGEGLYSDAWATERAKLLYHDQLPLRRRH